jgi:uncharacterized protein (DUF1697 family)
LRTAVFKTAAIPLCELSVYGIWSKILNIVTFSNLLNPPDFDSLFTFFIVKSVNSNNYMRANNTFIALFRAINVGGHAVIKMAELKNMFENLGFSDVSTYIQTGNVVFSTGEKDKVKIAAAIEKKFKSITGYERKVFILTNDKLIKAASKNPFEPEKHTELLCHLMFLSGKPSAENLKALMKLEGEEYRFHVHDDVLYFAYDKKYAGNRRNIDFEKILGATGTARSWKVVDKLIKLSVPE